ncbi:MAG: peptidylprolyl isomerase, partial [Bacteroidales bacterium]|nr:peptidylprolyl isomerase [Bacteroidales bacterium]
VLPSQDDYKEAERKINDIHAEFGNIEASESKQYVTFNSDQPYDPTNYVKGELSNKLDSFAFNSEIGAVYGPYFEDESYKLAKLTSKKQLPDSVKTRHILLPFDQSNFQQVQQLSDSLANLIKGGASFSQLAQEHSIDEETKSTGGDLGWMTEQVMTSSNGLAIKDSCFLKSKGHVFTFATQAGIRIIQISNQSRPVTKVQVGILAKEVTPGTKTRQQFYSEASEFAGRNKTLSAFEKAANEAGYYINDVPNLKQSTRSISGIPGSRQIVRWAFNTAETGSISSPFDFNDSYYVVALIEAREDGYRSFEDLRDILTSKAIKEKKAEKLMAELKSAVESATSIDDIASKAGSRVVDATDVSFRNISIGEANNELRLIGAATTADAGILKQPIKGEYGVYVLSIENINETPAEQLTGDFTFERQTIERSYTRNLGYGGLNTVLQELAHVKEHRTLFF